MFHALLAPHLLFPLPSEKLIKMNLKDQIYI